MDMDMDMDMDMKRTKCLSYTYIQLVSSLDVKVTDKDINYNKIVSRV